jgi:hypothetical protein
MRDGIEDTAEITRRLLFVFTELPRPDIAAGLDRYLWRHARLGFAEQLADALDDVRSGSAGRTALPMVREREGRRCGMVKSATLDAALGSR